MRLVRFGSFMYFCGDGIFNGLGVFDFFVGGSIFCDEFVVCPKDESEAYDWTKCTVI
jgi:hypothetical protein